MNDPRTLQANERTLLAWLRTGLSLITFGFVIAKTAVWLRVEDAAARAGVSQRVGTLFIFLGAAAEVLGLVRYLRVKRALLAGRSVPTGAGGVIALVVIAAVLGFALGVRGLFLATFAV
jgi:putative membrane protein